MPILTSGGAEGADTLFTEMALKAKHQVYNISFDGHKTNCPERWILPQSQLELANPIIEQVSVSLSKKVPKNNYVLKLIQRNYFQIRRCEMVVAVAPLNEQQNVEGGTGWAVAMAKQRLIPIYVFNIAEEKEDSWYLYNYLNGLFEKCDKPKITGRYAGIGSRILNKWGIEAIKSLYL